jgi:glycogen synthase
MRVLLVTHDFPPSTLGGEGMVAGHLARLLALEGIELEVVAPDRDGAAEYDSGEPYIVHRVDSPARTFLRRTPAFYLASAAVIRHYQGDVIYYFRPGVLRKDIPAVVHFHTTRLGEALGCFRLRAYLPAILNLLFVPLERFMARSAVMVIALTEAMTVEIARFASIDQKSISVLSNPLAVDQWVGQVSSDRSMGGVRLLYVGRLDLRKGIFDLLEAFKRSVSIIDDISLRIVGNGPMLGSLKSWVKQNGCGDLVTFQSGVSTAEVKSLYQHHDLVVVPSIYEPFGVVVAEALASGTPVISSDVCVNLGQVRFPSGDIDALTNAIVDAAHELQNGRSPVKDTARVVEALGELREEVVVKKLLNLFSLAISRFDR